MDIQEQGVWKSRRGDVENRGCLFYEGIRNIPDFDVIIITHRFQKLVEEKE